MYQVNEMELWIQRRQELVRESDSGRLARRLKGARSKMAVRLRGALLGWASPRAPARGGWRKGMRSRRI